MPAYEYTQFCAACDCRMRYENENGLTWGRYCNECGETWLCENERIAAEEKEIWDNAFDKFTARLNAIVDRDEYEQVAMRYGDQLHIIRASGNI